MIVKKRTIELAFTYALFILWMLLVLFEIKEYNVWSQILSIDINDNVFQNMYETHHPHLLRFALMYPIILLSEYLNIDLNLVFGIEALVINLIIFFLLNKIMNHIFQTKRYYILVLLLLFSINLFMHGRIIFGFFGISILLHTFYFNTVKEYSNIKFFTIIAVALFLMSVSTGTFIVGIVSVVLYILLNTHYNYSKTKKLFNFKILLLIIGLIAIKPLIQQYIDKNLDYFDGSVILMLSHGIGRIFYNQYVLFTFLLFLPVASIMGIIMYKKTMKNIYYVTIVPILIATFSIGLFGHSTLSVGLPAIFTLISIYINKKRIK